VRPLPIDPLLPEVAAALRTRTRLVLRAAPGAGKTTRVPAAILDAGLASERHVVVLEPRRIAARAAAEWVARERGGAVGGEVGYRVRFEQRGGPATRLWFVTEGVFGRRLVADPFLEDVGAVVLDEFHERHLQGDVALAAVRHLQDTVRPDLRLVVMSATLETDALARTLGDPAVLTSEGRAFPVEIEHDETPPGTRPLPARVAAALRRLLDQAGDVLVFLPGAAEIRRTAEAIASLAAANGFDVVPLHGYLPLDAQERALRSASRRASCSRPTPPRRRSPSKGSPRSSTRCSPASHASIRATASTCCARSRAAADQRGRAGRTAPGRRPAWSRAEHAGRRAHRFEISARPRPHAARAPRLGPRGRARACLARSATAGCARARGAAAGTPRRPRPGGGRAHTDRPPHARAACRAAPRAVAGRGRARALPRGGRAPRRARERARHPRRGALAFGDARDFPPGPSDVSCAWRCSGTPPAAGFARRLPRTRARARAVHAVERARRQLAQRLGGARGGAADVPALLRCTLAGFPDRVARRRAPGAARAVMVGGTGVALAPESVVREAGLFVAVDLERGAGPEARVRLASAIEAPWLAELFPGAVGDGRELVFDAGRGRVVERVWTYQPRPRRDRTHRRRSHGSRRGAGGRRAADPRPRSRRGGRGGYPRTRALPRQRDARSRLADGPERARGGRRRVACAGAREPRRAASPGPAGAILARLSPRSARRSRGGAHGVPPAERPHGPIRYAPDRPPAVARASRSCSVSPRHRASPVAAWPSCSSCCHRASAPCR
jgi:ATP-dependent helicase HrpB